MYLRPIAALFACFVVAALSTDVAYGYSEDDIHGGHHRHGNEAWLSEDDHVHWNEEPHHEWGADHDDYGHEHLSYEVVPHHDSMLAHAEDEWIAEHGHNHEVGLDSVAWEGEHGVLRHNNEHHMPDLEHEHGHGDRFSHFDELDHEEEAHHDPYHGHHHEHEHEHGHHHGHEHEHEHEHGHHGHGHEHEHGHHGHEHEHEHEHHEYDDMELGHIEEPFHHIPHGHEHEHHHHGHEHGHHGHDVPHNEISHDVESHNFLDGSEMNQAFTDRGDHSHDEINAKNMLRKLGKDRSKIETSATVTATVMATDSHSDSYDHKHAHSNDKEEEEAEMTQLEGIKKGEHANHDLEEW